MRDDISIIFLSVVVCICGFVDLNQNDRIELLEKQVIELRGVK